MAKKKKKKEKEEEKDLGAGRRSYRCRICRRSIRIPEGWSMGPAVRRHYWRKHREVMQRSAEGAEE